MMYRRWRFKFFFGRRTLGAEIYLTVFFRFEVDWYFWRAQSEIPEMQDGVFDFFEGVYGSAPKARSRFRFITTNH